jgi:hypothetical protein
LGIKRCGSFGWHRLPFSRRTPRENDTLYTKSRPILPQYAQIVLDNPIATAGSRKGVHVSVATDRIESSENLGEDVQFLSHI